MMPRGCVAAKFTAAAGALSRLPMVAIFRREMSDCEGLSLIRCDKLAIRRPNRPA